MKSRLNSPVPKPQILKKAGAVAATVLLLAFLLLDPVRASEASAAGLLLWFHTLVPVLLPFFILSSLLIALDGVSSLMGFLYPILHRIFGCSREGCFCLASGFLCGFPTGARITGELVRTRHISVEDLAFGVPVLFGLFTRRGRSFSSLPAEKKTSGSQISFKIADACIMSGLESILKLGCYIILFSLLAGLLKGLPWPHPALACALTGFLEITNGISLTAASNLPARLSFALILGTAAFGGLSGLAQTQSMIDGSGLSLGRYLKAKLLTALAAASCALALEPFLS